MPAALPFFSRFIAFSAGMPLKPAYSLLARYLTFCWEMICRVGIAEQPRPFPMTLNYGIAVGEEEEATPLEDLGWSFEKFCSVLRKHKEARAHQLWRAAAPGVPVTLL